MTCEHSITHPLQERYPRHFWLLIRIINQIYAKFRKGFINPRTCEFPAIRKASPKSEFEENLNIITESQYFSGMLVALKSWLARPEWKQIRSGTRHIDGIKLNENKVPTLRRWCLRRWRRQRYNIMAHPDRYRKISWVMSPMVPYVIWDNLP